MKTKLLVVVFFISKVLFAQQLYFPKSHYTDSTAMALHLPELAQKAALLYKESNATVYKDNLFRLQLVAKNYGLVASIIREVAQNAYKDSTTVRSMGFPFRVYANTCINSPGNKSEFSTVFLQQFYKLYSTLNDDDKNTVDIYYEKDVAQFKKSIADKLSSFSKDSISVADAVALCRSYCSYLTFSTTGALAKKEIQHISEAKYSIDDTIVLTMSDGGTVAVTLARSKKEATPQPVVFLYNIYSGADISRCKEAVDKGFVGVVANTRGKRLSKDAVEPFEHDAKDAYEIIDWISKQPWCNGKIGMYGGSYLGFSQWSAVKKKHPALKTIVPQVAVAAGVDYPMSNGVFMSYMLRWSHYVSNLKNTDVADFSNETHWKNVFEDYYKSGKSFRELDAIEGRPNALFQRWLNHPSYDRYWQNMTPQKEEFGQIDIPILTTTGYYDDDQTGAMYYYKQYQKWNKNDNYYLIIGPYDHYGAQGYPQASLNDYTIDEVANIPIQSIVFEWFNYILKNGPKPAILKDKVNYELMGANVWNHAPSLAKMSNETLTYHPSSLKENDHYVLSSKLHQNESVAQSVDFKDRSIIKSNTESSFCGFDLLQPKTLPLDKNLLVFESEPLAEALAITGTLKANLVMECNKKDLDIVVQLYEKKPDGTYFALSNNLQRASYSKDQSKRQLLQPNHLETIVLEKNYLACKQLEKGSRIVILLGVNNNPDWQINYGTGKDVSDETITDAAIPLNIKWYSTSTFEIPVLK